MVYIIVEYPSFIITEDQGINDIISVGEPMMGWNSTSKEFTIIQVFKTDSGSKYDKILANFEFYKNGKVIGSKHVYIEVNESKNKITAKLSEKPDTFGFEIISVEKFPNVGTEPFPGYN